VWQRSRRGAHARHRDEARGVHIYNHPYNHLTTTLTPQGIVPLIQALKARGVHIYLLTGGFREIALPIAGGLLGFNPIPKP
jgi:phosphoserine phosphatase